MVDELRELVLENSKKIDEVSIKLDTFIDNDFHEVKSKVNHTNLYITVAAIANSIIILITYLTGG